MANVLEFHEKGYNCAESMIKAINEEKGLNIPVSIASPFGGGMSVGSTCGAVTGALMILGALKGREDSSEKNQTRTYAKEIINKIKEKYGTTECIELKKNGVTCNEIIEFTYNALKDSIE